MKLSSGNEAGNEVGIEANNEVGIEAGILAMKGNLASARLGLPHPRIDGGLLDVA